MDAGLPSVSALLLQGPTREIEPAAVEEGSSSVHVRDPQQNGSRVHGLLESPVAVQDRQLQDRSLLGLAGFRYFAPPQMIHQRHATEAAESVLDEGPRVFVRIVEQAFLRREKERGVEGGQGCGGGAGLPTSHEHGMKYCNQ